MHKVRCLDGVSSGGAIQDSGRVTVASSSAVILLTAVVRWKIGVITDVKTESGWFDVTMPPCRLSAKCLRFI